MNKKSPNPSKVTRVGKLVKLLDESKSVAIVDYTGLKVSQATDLRRQIKAAGGEMKVEKNTLFKIALGPLSNQLTNNQLTGLSAFIFAKTDEIAPLKALADFKKKNSVLAFKLGIYNDKILSAVEIENLANTPNLKASLAKFLFLLNYNTARLVRTLNAIAKKGGDN